MANTTTKRRLSPEQHEELLRALKARFEKNMNRHKGLEWAKVQAKLDPPAGGEKLWSLNEMERTGGEPDVVFWFPPRGVFGPHIYYYKGQSVTFFINCSCIQDKCVMYLGGNKCAMQHIELHEYN